MEANQGQSYSTIAELSKYLREKPSIGAKAYGTTKKRLAQMEEWVDFLIKKNGEQ